MSDLARARSLVREAGGDALVERLEHLDRLRVNAAPPRDATSRLAAPDGGGAVDFDVVIAGGGLWSLLAPILAARGLRVAILDRARVGAAHREWNASDGELRALVATGLVTPSELEALVVARYRSGVCRFHGGGTYPVDGVLDCAVDAGPLLSIGRDRGAERGVTFLDGHEVVAHAAGASRVAVRALFGDSTRELTARLLVDARGAASPHATADLVCPTVGGTMVGLAEGDAPDEVDPAIGEILATVDGIEGGRQHVWEGFPGRAGETTVYLFYYSRAGAAVSLIALYARFFATLASYKRGDARMLRPTFGLIPGWSRLSPAPRAPDRRVVLVGDAAARHSPLTYCGFGATLRSLAPSADAIERRLTTTRAGDDASIVHDAPIHALTGVLAHMMASRAFAGDELNQLLDAAFHTLHAMGNRPYAALLRDEMSVAEFVAFLRKTASRHPAVWGKVARGLGAATVGRWGLGLARTLVTGR